MKFIQGWYLTNIKECIYTPCFIYYIHSDLLDIDFRKGVESIDSSGRKTYDMGRHRLQVGYYTTSFSQCLIDEGSDRYRRHSRGERKPDQDFKLSRRY